MDWSLNKFYLCKDCSVFVKFFEYISELDKIILHIIYLHDIKNIFAL
jgi:hypothetical protein